jgi:serine/threonine-protein kinase
MPPHPRAGRESEFAATVQSMPAADSGLLDSLPASNLSLPPLDVDEAALASEHPTLSHIGRYALKKRLGEGGLGTVYEAWDPLLSRTVAVKTLQFDLDTPSRVSLDGLFINEARLAAGLSHPNIVTIFDAGLSAHGVYIAMERLHGRDLREALAEGWAPTTVQAAQLVRRLADGLAYAHARGVVHCDIKPANIFLNPKDKPKILDFGIARALHGAALPALDGLVAGSPYYLAPEQLSGETIDARSDIYSLGVVFFELLAGRKAFDGNSLAAIADAVLNGRAPTLEAVRPELTALMPAQQLTLLAAIVGRAMAREPASRFASAAELSQQLRRWIALQASAEAAAPPKAPALDSASTSSPTSADAKRPGRARAWTGGLLAVLVAGVLGWAVMGPAEPPATPFTPPSAVLAIPPVPLAAAPLPPQVTATERPASEPAPGAAEPAVAAATPAATAPTKPAPRPRQNLAGKKDSRPAAAPPPPAPAPALGTVQIAVSPWGQVEINGVAAGTTPPLTRLSLPTGTHTITVRNEDFPPYTTTLEVTADKPVTLRHRFGS